jgi:flagellar protein FlgJ
MLLAMNLAPDTGPINALDPRGVDKLKALSKTKDPAALKAAAQQFEALFLQMVLKSMREATPREGLFDSDQSRMYESLLDQQLAQVLSSKKGTGLAEVIERQLRRASDPEASFPDGLPLSAPTRSYLLESLGKHSSQLAAASPASATKLAPAGDATLGNTLADIARGAADVPENVRNFVNRFLPEASQAASAAGIPPAFLLAHAALESGWGKSEPRFADGRPSYNLFGIKAGAQWSGERVVASTTEVIAGVAQRRDEPFRAYASYAEGFADYARLLSESPRYAGVVGSTDAAAFSAGLQKAGYATDPHYASKLQQVIARLR